MVISTAPVIFNLDSEIVNAVIMQLELENETKDNHSAAKHIKIFLKNGTDGNSFYSFLNVQFVVNNSVDYFYISKKYIKTFFPRVPTPPPNYAC